MAQDGKQRHSNIQLKDMQFVVTACCIVTSKLAEVFRFSSARRSGGSGVQPVYYPVAVIGGQSDCTSMGCRSCYVE